MLKLLHIENIAVVARADLEFQSGLNVLTGETGAGKSIIIDAIGALMGERTSRDIIRTGEKQAFVSASFDGCGAEMREALEALGLAWNEDGTLTVARRVYADGRNLCHVNGLPAPLSALRELGALLCRSLGQHDSRSLLDPGEHLQILDRYAGVEALLAEYTAALTELKAIRAKQKALVADIGSIDRQRDLLTYTINEIESANVQQGEDDELIAKRAAAQNSGKIASSLNAAIRALESMDGSAAECAESAARALAPLCGQKMAGIDRAVEQLTEASGLLRDCMDTLETALETSTFSEQELDDIETRLALLSQLKRKYGGTLESVCASLDKARADLERLTGAEEESARLAEEYHRQYQKTLALAQALSSRRKQAAETFSARICEELAYLQMGGSRFSVRFDPRERDGRIILGGDGIDLVEFYISANRGESERPLAKTASGGELSRIMLAMNTVQTADNTPTLVFDEIDAGISGIAASRVARRLAALAKKRQVLCVTHLSQLAVFADAHYRIRKDVTDGRTLTTVTQLDEDGRIGEVARINGGELITDATRTAAADQLTQARAEKAKERNE